MKQITFLPYNIVCEIGRSSTVLEVALKNKIPINHSCGGHGTCGTCLVRLPVSINNPPRNELETDMAMDRGFDDDERLSCQLPATPDLKVIIR